MENFMKENNGSQTPTMFQWLPSKGMNNFGDALACVIPSDKAGCISLHLLNAADVLLGIGIPRRCAILQLRSHKRLVYLLFHGRCAWVESARYGAIFTCLMSWAVHLEVADSLETDAFINALRRFIAIRGPIRQLRCDRGTNFIGAKNEFEKVRTFLLKNNCDDFEFQLNVPSASHMGGVWERQIRTVRNVLRPLLDKHGDQLDDDSLRTLFYEVMAIVNSRPLSVSDLCDPLSPEILTPNHILTMKTKVVLPPPGAFPETDVYSRKRWRRVQHLLNVFWSRWKTEYLSQLQTRQKWNTSQRNMMPGDITILKEDDSPRNKWPLAIMQDVYPSGDGLVRSAHGWFTPW